MNLKHLSDQALHEGTVKFYKTEQSATVALLHHLRENERRRLYAKRSHSRLLEYCTRELGYAEAPAQRRINASRLLGELPELEVKVSAGALTLTTLSQAQSFFRQESIAKQPFSKEEKRQVMKKLEHQSTRRTEQILVSIASSPPPAKETVRAVAGDLTEIKFLADEKLMRDLNRLREIWAGRLPRARFSQLIARAVACALENEDPLLKAKRRSKTPTAAEPRALITQNLQSSTIIESSTINTSPPSTASESFRTAPPAPESFVTSVSSDECPDSSSYRPKLKPHPVKPTRYIRASVRDEVRLRDEDQCTYLDPTTKLRCTSRHGLQPDHIVAYAFGGENSTANLRLRCPAHNQLHAIREFGTMHMARYILF